MKWDEEINAPAATAYRVGINGFLFAEITDPFTEPIKATIYVNDVLKKTKLLDTDYQYRKRRLKDYESESWVNNWNSSNHSGRGEVMMNCSAKDC